MRGRRISGIIVAASIGMAAVAPLRAQEAVRDMNAGAVAPLGADEAVHDPGAATAQAGRVSRSRYLMGTRCEGTVVTGEGTGVTDAMGVAALEAAFDEIARLESILSDWRDDSELSRLRGRADKTPVTCSEDLFRFLEESVTMSRRTQGAFDITVAPLISAWDMRGDGRVASQREIEAALARVGSEHLLLSATDRSVRFGVAGMALDPGAIGKGYALDAAERVLRARGVGAALLDFGGQIQAIGAPPGQAGWEVDVAHPNDRERGVLTLIVRDVSVSTSGNAERTLMVAGRDIGHIINPRTGQPIPTRDSATVIAPTGTEADAASTAVLVMGRDAGLAWAASQTGLGVVWIGTADDGTPRTFSTPGFERWLSSPPKAASADDVDSTLVHARRLPAAPPADDSATIADLERRVADLEAALAARRASASPDAEELKRRIDMLAEELAKARMGKAAAPRELKSVHGLGLGASKVYESDQGVSIAGYGEAIYQDFDAERDDGERSGATSQADLLRAVVYLGYKFTDTIVFNSEIEYEHASTGESGEVSVEFATLDFLLHDAAAIRAGLVLMPIGFINELHEPPIFLGARRPDVERAVIPTTWREPGVGLFGDAGPFSYRAYAVTGLNAEEFTAGTGVRNGRQDGSQAAARDLAFTARVDYQGVPGLLIGGSFYQGDSGQGAEDPVTMEVIDGTVTLYELHTELNLRGLNVRGLWTSMAIDDADSISALTGQTIGSRLEGWYGQAGYDVLSHFAERTRQAVIPFVRYERYDTQDEVEDGFVTTGVNDVKVITFGAAWKPIPQLAVKVDVQDIDRSDGTGTDQLNAAIGYVF